MLLQLSQLFPLCPPPPRTPNCLGQSPHHCSCPWVMHMDSLLLHFLCCALHPRGSSVTTYSYFLIPSPFYPLPHLRTFWQPSKCSPYPWFCLCSSCLLSLSSCYPGTEAQREWVCISWCGGSLRGSAWDSRCFSSIDSIPASFCSQKLWGLIFLAQEPWAGRVWCGAGTPHSWQIPPQFLSTTCGCGTNLFCISASPTSLDGCGLFNSVVVGLPFNSISYGSEWWLLYILVVILRYWVFFKLTKYKKNVKNICRVTKL